MPDLTPERLEEIKARCRDYGTEADADFYLHADTDLRALVADAERLLVQWIRSSTFSLCEFASADMESACGRAADIVSVLPRISARIENPTP